VDDHRPLATDPGHNRGPVFVISHSAPFSLGL
jgi:hypothetical protein